MKKDDWTAVAHLILVGFVLTSPAFFVGCIWIGLSETSDIGPLEIFTGPEARELIARDLRTENVLPWANEFYYARGGNLFGGNDYWSFSCLSVGACFHAIKQLGGPSRDQFKSWVPSKFAVVMAGPGFYGDKYAHDPWDVREIQSGFVYENSEAGELDYYAVDANRCRVFHHFESGGWPRDLYPQNQETPQLP